MISQLADRVQSMLFIAPVILLAIVCHECAHGWVSYKLGDPTAKNAGRLTLNPFKHLDIMGTLCLLVFRVGWAKPVPIDPRYYQDRKKGIIYVSLAGPVTNFVLAFISLLVEGFLMRFGSHASTVIWILCQLCYYSAVVNVGLGLFNLIPIPPLDGSKIVGMLSSWAAAQYAKLQHYWRVILIVLLVTGILSKPLNWLNDCLIDLMWRLVCLILRF
ncbi:MAG: site-2 protease family protein [Oscillospiraceae bacterium]|nr:site-2 protease family protein [Oscillospiraceae bacterium]